MQKLVPSYNVMAPVNAALEVACRYLAYELGPRKIRVNAISRGPLKNRAAAGLKDFDRMLNDAVERSPVGESVDNMDVGRFIAPEPRGTIDQIKWQVGHNFYWNRQSHKAKVMSFLKVPK